MESGLDKSLNTTESQTTEQMQAQNVRRLELLRQIGLELSSQLDLNTLLQSIVEKAITLVNADSGGLYIYRPQQDVLEWAISVGSNVSPPGTILHKGEGVSGQAWATSQSVVLENNAQWPHRASIYTDYEWQAVMAVPIHWGSTILGVLDILATRPFSPQDVTTIELFATQVATAIHNAHLFEQEHKQRVLAETLTEITLLLASHTDTDSLLREVLVQAYRLVPYKTANVMLVDGTRLRVAQWRGYETYGMSDYMNGLVQNLDDLPPDKVAFAAGQVLLIRDTREHPDWVVLPESSWVRSYLSIPIVSKGQTLGVLRMDGDEVGEFDDDDVARLRPLVNAAAIALDNAQLLHKTQEQNRELITLHHISEIVQSAQSLEHLVQRATETISKATHFPIVIIELYDPETQTMVINGLVGFAGLTGLPNIQIPLQDALGGLVVQLGTPLIELQAHTKAEYQRSPLRHLNIETFLGIPLHAGPRVIGALCLISTKRWQRDEEFIQWLTGLADYVGSIIEQKRNEEAMRHTQKLESLGVMAGGVAHDFNNLLTALVMQNTILLHKLGENTPVRENLRQIAQITQRAAELTRQLLAYAGRVETEIETLDLNRMVKENEHLLHTSIPRSITLEISLKAALPPIQADPGQIQQVIMNLIINAAESYEGKPGTVWVSTNLEHLDEQQPTSRVWNRTLPTGPYVCFTVQDRGKGMNEITLRRIFEPFFTTKLTGRGLGLAAVLGIVRSHGGDIKVISQLGMGTTFQVWLPAVPNAELIDSSGRAPAQPSHRLLHEQGYVLIIDDEAILRKAFSEVLSTERLNILLAENGQVGISLFEKHRSKICLIMLDMTMPIMSGQDVLNYLNRIGTNVPIIVFSGYKEDIRLSSYRNLHIVGFLHKPFHLSELLNLVYRALDVST